jgi:glycine cleavage system H protein
MDFPSDLSYTPEDEWVRVEDGEASIGITGYAQDQLGDIVFVDLPEPGRTFSKGETFGVIESVKAVSDLFMPLSGEVIARNERLADEPELVNESPYEDGWMIRVRIGNAEELDALLSADAYRDQLPED